MISRRTMTWALLAACAALPALVCPSSAAVPAIARAEAIVSRSDLVMTFWYADRAEVRTRPYAPDRDGGWGCQLYLPDGQGQLEVDGIREENGEAPALSRATGLGAGLQPAHYLGNVRFDARPYGLVVVVPLAWLGSAQPTSLPYKLQLYVMQDLGPAYNHVLQSQFVSEYEGTFGTPGLRVGRAGAAPAAADVAPALAGTTWGGLKARYR